MVVPDSDYFTIAFTLTLPIVPTVPVVEVTPEVSEPEVVPAILADHLLPYVINNTAPFFDSEFETVYQVPFNRTFKLQLPTPVDYEENEVTISVLSETLARNHREESKNLFRYNQTT